MIWRKWQWAVPFAVGLVLMISAPYLLAWGSAPEGSRFTGLLFNPLDGHSYIAKMRQGAEGSWVFRLPFTSEAQPGAPIYLFYLFLGHISRWLQLPLISVYHAARLAGGLLMVGATGALAVELTQVTHERRAMLFFVTCGAGLGWIVGIVGPMTADLWVAEAFPLYAALSNAHFPLAIALMALCALFSLCVMRCGERTWLWGSALGCAAILLGAVQPFGLVPVFGGVGVSALARIVRQRAIVWSTVIWVVGAALAASLYPIYMQSAIQADPVLRVWGHQNITASPPLWDWVLSYGMLAPLCVIGLYVSLRRGNEADWLVAGWLGVTLIGLYVPLPLQRRLSLGLGVPVGLLAGAGWWRGVRRGGLRRVPTIARVAGTVLCVLTPAFLIAASTASAVVGDDRFFISDDEWRGLAWLRDAGDGRGVMCAPETGLFVPAWAGQPVVYGHPFETVEAERRRAEVEAFWLGEMAAAERETFLRQHRIGYLFVGPRERALGAVNRPDVELGDLRRELSPVFNSGAVTIYELRPEVG